MSDPLADDPLAAFSPDYFVARERFRAGAVAAGAAVESFPVPVGGTAGELTIDAATLGDSSAKALLVLSGGLHGVEGFFGSAVQLAALGRREVRPRGVRVLMLHALNPFGFARLRRFNEDNVDLNRNFFPPGDAGAYPGGSPLYAALDALLNPPTPPGRGPAALAFILRAAGVAARQGLRHGRAGVVELLQAVAGGQYDFPRGIFFGGRGPAFAHRFLREHLPRWVGDARRVLHLDFHTGLGKWGTCQLLSQLDPADARCQWLRDAFGTDAVRHVLSMRLAYAARGSFDDGCETLFGGGRYAYLCAEFGTYPALIVLERLCRENRAHHWGRPDDPATSRAKRDLLEAFCPASARWRRRVLGAAVNLVDRAVIGLGG